ncbi:uncharacterized protein LOC108627258 [Ceratina calcarata]|uniref:Uncharacterized protein LOC108627258 n=1 Tax=Ceratina calcarata TaxID=156304 RepID=A0AAJ7J3G1_9HYME|nr:uncharacterized protein LOC108627258 [Ceratina calcarata]
MNNLSDFSQISDINNISRISRVNCSRLLGRVDSLQNLFEQQCSLSSNTSRNVQSNQGSNHLEKAVKSLTLCDESIGEYGKSNIITECIKEASNNVKGALSNDTATKLKGLLLIHDLNKYMHLPSTSSNVQELNVLGIIDLPQYDLSYEEKLDIKSCVETLLREKIHDFILRYEQLGGSMKEVVRSNDCNAHKKALEPYDMQILQWKDKIEQLCIQYETDITKFKTLMNKWDEMKYKDMNKIYFEKAEYILIQAQVAEVQAKITKLSCILKMYKEAPVTVDAHRILNAALDEKMFSVMNEIKEKQSLKSQYETLQNKEYDEVLKTYLDFCNAIKKKKQLLHKLNKVQ